MPQVDHISPFRMPQVDDISTLATAPTGTKSPDSITLTNGDVWVAYANGADSQGLSGFSTIVEYDHSGKIDQSYQIPGYVDGLKFNPVTGDIWALQNQDGNSTLTIIDPQAHSVSPTLSYANASSSRGYDDVVFTDGKVFLSYTNPTAPPTSGEPIIVQLLNGNDPHSPLLTKPILTLTDGVNKVTGVTGLNTETGKIDTVVLTDPDSLKLTSDGDLLLSGGADGVIVDVHEPGTNHQTVSFTQIQGVAIGSAGLDDVIKTNAESGTFYLSDTKDNRVLSVHISDLNPKDYYVALGDAFGQVDPHTGKFTPLITAANAPGGMFGSVHGVAFVADHSDDSSEAQHQSRGEAVAQTAVPNGAALALVGIVNALPDGLHLL